MKIKSLLETTQNTRDLGGYRTKGGSVTKYNRLLRSDVPNYPSEKDCCSLREHEIHTVIDLRGENEFMRRPCGFADREGFLYYNCPIEEGSGVPESVEAVPVSYLKIACAGNMRKVFRCLAAADGGVLFHCTAGKDRTGVVSAILLLHAGVSDADIVENYVLTREYGRERLALVHKNYPDIDMNIVTPREWYMEEFLRLFRNKFGDTYSYFEELGLSPLETARITEKII